jgi:hypothetical protein
MREEEAEMYAPKIARLQSKATQNSADLLSRRASTFAARVSTSETEEKVRGRSAGSSAVGLDRDFSTIRTHAPREGAIETTIPFRAVILSSGQNAAGKSKVARDAPAEEASAEPEPAGQQAATSPPVDEDKDVVRIAQMDGPPGIKDTVGVADTVSATFASTNTIAKGGVTFGAGDFGDTKGSLKRFSNVVITPSTGKFTVTADLKQDVNWDTRATVGPNNQVNIMSETDAALTSTNYPTAVSDLTPDLSDLKGRPPRTKFWSKDLTEKHEKYHVKDFTDVAKTGGTGAEAWLATQNAANAAEVRTLLDTAWSEKIFKVWDAFTDPPGVEERAYDDGAASYKARADAIKAKGDKGAAGGYPAPAPTPPAH